MLSEKNIFPVLSWIKAFRLPEVILMSGFFIIGSLFSIEVWAPATLCRLLALWFISFFTILSIYSYNSAAGKTADRYNIRLEPLRRYSARRYIIMGSIFLFIALALCFYISIWFAPLNTLVFCIWIVYSHPKWGLKHVPYWGTVLHFFAQIIHFNMYYFAFNQPDIYSFSLSVYLALAFAMGHLNHEIIDYDSDILAGVRNTTTHKGIRVSGVFVLLICLVSALFTLFIFHLQIFDLPSMILLFSPLMIHFILYLIWFKRLKERARTIRTCYRVIYFLSFLLLLLYRIFGPGI